MNENMIPAASADEIDLADILVSVLRHKWFFVVPVVIVTLAGIFAAIKHVPKYEYSVSIQIGQTASTPVEPPQTAVAKIQGGYIPEVFSKYHTAHPDDTVDYKMEINNPASSSIIVLSMKGPSNRESLLTGFLDEVTTLLVNEENKQIQGAIANLKAQLVVAKNKVVSLGDQVNLTKKQAKGTDKAIKLAGDEMARLQAHIEATTRSRDAVVQNGSKTDQSFTLLLLNNELTASRSQLFNLANQHDVTLPEQRATLDDQVRSLSRQIEEQQGVVNKIEAQIDAVVSTHSLTPPLQSPAPVGFSPAAILGLAVVAGVILGFIAVFAMVLIETSRMRLSSRIQ